MTQKNTKQVIEEISQILDDVSDVSDLLEILVNTQARGLFMLMASEAVEDANSGTLIDSLRYAEKAENQLMSLARLASTRLKRKETLEAVEAIVLQHSRKTSNPAH